MSDHIKDTFRGFIVPIQVLEDAALTVYEKMVYIVLRSFINPHKSEAFPSINKICELSGIGRTKVKESIDSLTSKGYITKQVNFQYNPMTRKSRQTSNVYNVELPNLYADPSRHTTGTPVATRPGPQSPHDHQELINKDPINKENEEDTTIPASAESSDSLLDFEERLKANRQTLFKGKRQLSQTEEWFLIYVTEGKFNLALAKRVVKKVNLSKIHKKVLFTVIDTALEKLKTGEIKHPVNWIAAVFENEQLLIDIMGGPQWVSSGKS